MLPPPPPPAPRRPPPLADNELLLQMQSVLNFGGQWHARRLGAKDFAKGATPGEAMRAALTTK